jgi:hypothetical protein
MAKKISGAKTSESTVAAVCDRRSPDDASPRRSQTAATKPGRPSSLLDTRVIYCGDNLEQLGPCRTGQCCNSAFRTPHSAIGVAGSFYYHCDWHASHYVKFKLDQIFVNGFVAN